MEVCCHCNSTDMRQISVAVYVPSRVKTQLPHYVVCLVQHRIGPTRTVSNLDNRASIANITDLHLQISRL